MRTAIAAAKDQIDQARHELDAVLRHYGPPERGRVIDFPGAETADRHPGR